MAADPRPRTEAPPDATERAWYLVRQVLGDGEMAERLRGLCEAYDLAPGPIKALQHLNRCDHLSMRDVARSLGCDPSYVTGLVDDLARHNFVERQVHPSDRRIKTVVLTSAGKEVAEVVEKTFGTPPAAFDALAPGDAEELARILSKVTGTSPSVRAKPSD